ncbi:DNA-binding protein [Clostridia bacterium]|nr:DNA-binding protein [Clostridia bacterium]
MKNNTVSVSPKIWDWVKIATSNQSIGKDWKEKMTKWISGEKQPTLTDLEKFSKATHIPFGYFLLKTPPKEKVKILEYRTVGSVPVTNPSRELVDTNHQMESIQDFMRDYMIQNYAEKLPFVGCVDSNMSVIEIASKIRDFLKIDENWYTKSKNADDSFRLLRQKISDTGIIVMLNGIVAGNTHRPLNIDEFRAFTLVDDYAPLIFINSTDSYNGKLFSLIHETVHIGLGTNSFFNTSPLNVYDVSPEETLTNVITAEILVPLAVFTEKWKECENIEKLASIFKCGSVVIARRALDSKFISQKTYVDLANDAKQNFLNSKNGKSKGGNYYTTEKSRIDNRFLLSLDSSVREGRTLFTDAYRLTNTNMNSFDRLVKEVRGEE